jgi:hypothetical protein
MNQRARTCFALAAMLALVAVSSFGQSRSWKEWSRKDAEKLLNDSPWAHLQVDTNTTELFYQPTADPRLSASGSRRAPNSGARLEEGATNQEVNVKYGIRFFSARPVRQAFVRLMQLKDSKIEPAMIERMNAFAEVPSKDSIIVAVTFEASDKRALGKVMQAFASAVSGTLKNTSYLERNDGKRLFLQEYVPPGRDGFGARFIFPRFVDGSAFINVDSGDIRFFAEYSPGLKLNMRFKVSDMMMDGHLEY